MSKRSAMIFWALRNAAVVLFLYTFTGVYIRCCSSFASFSFQVGRSSYCHGKQRSSKRRATALAREAAESSPSLPLADDLAKGCGGLFTLVEQPFGSALLLLVLREMRSRWMVAGISPSSGTVLDYATKCESLFPIEARNKRNIRMVTSFTARMMRRFLLFGDSSFITAAQNYIMHPSECSDPISQDRRAIGKNLNIFWKQLQTPQYVLFLGRRAAFDWIAVGPSLF